MLSVIDFINEHADFHSIMTYAPLKKSFNMEPYSENVPGIYFILDRESKDILKIGKSEAVGGLKERMSVYRNSLVSSFKGGDRTTVLWYRVMTGELLGRVLEMYILPIPSKQVCFKGIEVEAMIARSLEKKLSELANEQLHSMKLSGQN